jgi:hypothetical protein
MIAIFNRVTFLATALGTLGFLTCCNGGAQSNDTPNGLGFWDVTQAHNTMLLGVGIGPKRNNWAFHNQIAVPDVLIEQLLGMHLGENPLRQVQLYLVREAGSFEGTGSVEGRVAGGTILSLSPNEQYAADVQALGLTLSQRDLLELAVFDIDRATLTQALKQNPHVTVKAVVKAVSCERMAAWSRQIGADATVFQDCKAPIRPKLKEEARRLRGAVELVPKVGSVEPADLAESRTARQKAEAWWGSLRSA